MDQAEPVIKYLRNPEQGNRIFGCIAAKSPNFIGWSILHPLDFTEAWGVENTLYDIKESLLTIAAHKADHFEIIWDSVRKRDHPKISGLTLIDFEVLNHTFSKNKNERSPNYGKVEKKERTRSYTLREELFEEIKIMSQRIERRELNANTERSTTTRAESASN